MNNNSSVFFDFNADPTYIKYLQCDTYNSNTTTYNLTICMVAYMYIPLTEDSIGFSFFMNNGQLIDPNGMMLNWLIPMNCPNNINNIYLCDSNTIDFPIAYASLKPSVPFIFVMTILSTSTTVTMNICVNRTLASNNQTTYPYIENQHTNTPHYYINLAFTLGSFQSSFNGAYSSFALYNTVLSDTQRQQVEGYLAWKWWGSGSAILSDPHHLYDSTQMVISINYSILSV